MVKQKKIHLKKQEVEKIYTNAKPKRTWCNFLIWVQWTIFLAYFLIKRGNSEKGDKLLSWKGVFDGNILKPRYASCIPPLKA